MIEGRVARPRDEFEGQLVGLMPDLPRGSDALEFPEGRKVFLLTGDEYRAHGCEVDEQSYRAGYDEGYEKGKGSGYERGHGAGYDEGYDEGYRSARKDVGLERSLAEAEGER